MARRGSVPSLDRTLKSLIEKAGAPHMPSRFRKNIALVMHRDEEPKAICLVDMIWIGEDRLHGRDHPWFLVTDRQLILIQVSFANGLRDMFRTNSRCFCLDLEQITSVSELQHRDFMVHLDDGRGVRIHGRIWPDAKYAVASREALVAAVQAARR